MLPPLAVQTVCSLYISERRRSLGAALIGYHGRSWLAILVTVVAISELASTPARGSEHRITAEERAQGYTNRLVIAKPKAGLTAAEVSAAEVRDAETVNRVFSRLGNLRSIAPRPGENIRDAVARLRASGRYEYVEPDYIRQRHALPDDPRFANGDQWHLRNLGTEGGVPGADIGAPAGWDTRSSAAEVIVAVLDTGIRLTHEDLAGNLWVNPDEIAGNGIDDDQNGYVDDVHGINSLVARGAPGSGNPIDDHGHGTSVASVMVRSAIMAKESPGRPGG